MTEQEMQIFDKAIKEIIRAGGHPHLVGGAVRDQLLGIQSKDLDIEVFGLTPDQLTEALAKIGKPNVSPKSKPWSVVPKTLYGILKEMFLPIPAT